MSWPTVPLGQVADTALGKMLDRGKSNGHARVPYLRNVNVQWGRIDTSDLLSMELSEDERSRFCVGPGDVLVCEGGEIGRCAIWQGGDDYLAYQKALHRVRPHETLDARYLRYLLEKLAQDGTLHRLATGSTIAHLPQQQLRRVPVPLPSLDEQRRIVDILEDHLSRLDAATSYLDSAETKLATFAATGLWSATHTGAPRVPLRDVSEVKLGRQRSPKNHAGDRMISYLRAANVDWNRLRLEDVKSMNFTPSEEKTFSLRAGDILVTEASGSAPEVGKSAIYRGDPDRVCFQNTLLRVRCTGADPEFVQRYLLAEARAGQFMGHARGVGIHHLGRSRLSAWPIELPDSDTQARAIQHADAVLASTDRIGSGISQARARADRLRRSLMGLAFSGQLTGTSSDLDRSQELTGA